MKALKGFSGTRAELRTQYHNDRLNTLPLSRMDRVRRGTAWLNWTDDELPLDEVASTVSEWVTSTK